MLIGSQIPDKGGQSLPAEPTLMQDSVISQPGKTMEICPCGSGESFKDCCQPITTKKTKSVSLEQLARARHTAHATHDILFLKTIQNADDGDDSDWNHYQAEMNTMEWLQFNIIASRTDGEIGIVESAVVCKKESSVYRLREQCRYLRREDKWFFYAEEISEIKIICPCNKSHCLGCF